jgi:hypothetical protein
MKTGFLSAKDTEKIAIVVVPYRFSMVMRDTAMLP